MADLRVTRLDESTWADFAWLVERNNGVWGGCWCMAFHVEGVGRDRTAEQNRDAKRARVAQDRAHAALVYAEDDCVGWCQFGRTEELPRIKRLRAYSSGANTLPDWRITCFYVDPRHRRRGVAEFALAGALAEIAGQGGGTVESYPEAVQERTVSSSFLHNGTLALFERAGFRRDRPIGKHHWVVTKVIG